jgi:hypothetical protein
MLAVNRWVMSNPETLRSLLYDPRARQPYPYIHATYYDRSIGRGNYNALQFNMNKRYASGLAYQLSYTWSKSIDIGSSGWYGVEGQSVQDPYHITTPPERAGSRR